MPFVVSSVAGVHALFPLCMRFCFVFQVALRVGICLVYPYIDVMLCKIVVVVLQMKKSVAMFNAAQLNCAEPVAHGAKHTKVDPFYRSFFANAAVAESFCFTLT